MRNKHATLTTTQVTMHTTNVNTPLPQGQTIPTLHVLKMEVGFTQKQTPLRKTSKLTSGHFHLRIERLYMYIQMLFKHFGSCWVFNVVPYNFSMMAKVHYLDCKVHNLSLIHI